MSFLEEDKNQMTQVPKLFSDYLRRIPFYNFGFLFRIHLRFLLVKKRKPIGISIIFIFLLNVKRVPERC